MTPPHIVDLAEHLEAVERGELKRLMVIMPPRHGKSELISLRFPCWYMGRHTTDLIAQAGYSESIALTHSRKARDIFIAPEMTQLFPDIRYRPERAAQETIVPERQAAHEWGTKQGGSYFAVGIGGGLTGRGYNIGIIDDPVKDAEEAESATYRQRGWEWYTHVFYTRQAPGAAIILVMTRWHHADLAGRLLQLSANDPNADQWTVLHYPAISEDGKALWPERYDLKWLLQVKAGQADNPEEPGQGSRAFEALYQGRPSLVEGQVIRREWWKYYDPDNPPVFDFTVHSWDTAFKDKQENDFSVNTHWGVCHSGYYLLNVWRRKVEFPELKTTAIAMHDRDHPNAVIVEDKASGQSLIQELQRETAIPILPIKVDTNKLARANAVTPLMESGRVWLPKSAPWLHDYIEELANFPNGNHDDQVDSTTQALTYLRTPPEPEDAVIVLDTMSMESVNMDL